MDFDVLKPKKRTAPKGSCSVDLISKIVTVKGEGANVVFCLTRDSFMDTFLFANEDKNVSYKTVDGNEIVEIYYTKSKGV